MSNKRNVLIMFGGIAPEHEVSVITGLQVVENIDRKKYNPLPVYLSKEGLFYLYSNLQSRKDFKKEDRELINFEKDQNGTFIKQRGLFKGKTYIDVAYLAFHGGIGESGQVQGMLDVLGIPCTSPNTEGSVISMNKALTNEVLRFNNIPCVDGFYIHTKEVKKNITDSMGLIKDYIAYPMILKPAHLGSSIGISVAKNDVELEKALLEISQMDTEIVVEKFLEEMTEYNCAVREIDGKLETSEIEKPLSQDEILSFADKYQRGGGKKTGSGEGGMASLVRELPAKIDKDLERKIKDLAKKIFRATRCKGMVRIDFMVTPEGKIYTTEINPIPGSMAYYLWEASGISFQQQITDMIEQGIKDFNDKKSLDLNYDSDIVERFVNSK